MNQLLTALLYHLGDVDLIHSDINEKDNLYHYQMYWLWVSEFMVYDEDINNGNLMALLRHRRIGIETAVCQRLAYLSLFSCMSSRLRPRSYFSLFSCMSSRPRLRSSVTSDLPRMRSGIVNLSPEIDHCQWLSTEETPAFPAARLFEPPYFLWDRTLGKTVEVRSLPEPPTYSIISHTWGRWRKTDPHVSVAGVPWLIPPNSRFDVANLADLVNTPVFQTRYIWLDLLCIPQSEAEESLLVVRDAEIARQTEIFRGAYRAYAWLNDVESWQGLTHACHWISLSYLIHTGTNRTAAGIMMEEVAEHAMKSTQLVSNWDYSSRPAPHDLVPIGWFSSLWTLQEICIRPDMVLLNKDFIPFSLGPAPEDHIVPFDSIVALVNGYHNAICWLDYKAPNTQRPDLPPVFDVKFLYEAFTMKLDPHIIDVEFAGESHRTYHNGAAHTWRWKKEPTKAPHRKTKIDAVEFEREVDRPYMSKGRPIVPKGPSELICLLRLTRLDELLSMSRTDIIWAGNSRYFKRNRAEAIMSVVGATDWFRNRLETGRPRDNSEDDLILEKYPREFLEEVIEKIGAMFFFTNARFFDLMVPLCVLQHEDGTLQEVRIVAGHGTLLPVASDRRQLSFLQVFDVSWGLHDHHSLRSWTLLSTGGFDLHKVGILASSTDMNNSPEGSIKALVSGPLPGTGISPGRSVGQADVNLREYLRSFMPGNFKVAIVLSSGPQEMIGLILLERAPLGLPGIPESRKRTFVKVGLFRIDGDYPVPEAQVVDWEVL